MSMDMEKFFRRPWVIVAVIAAITVFFGVQLPKARMDNNVVSFLPEGNPAKVNTRHLEEMYGDSTVAMVGLERPYGTVFEPEDILFPPDSYIFGVRFLPCYNPVASAPDLFRALARDKTADALAVLADTRTLESIMATTDFREQIRLFMDGYRARRAPQGRADGAMPLSGYVAGEIVKTAGAAKFEDIADGAGYTTRYLNKMFTEAYGFSPKTFARIMRFQNMIGALCVGKEPDFSGFAAELGYSDQSHMIKDFKEFVHLTPKKYLNALNQGRYNEKLIIL